MARKVEAKKEKKKGGEEENKRRSRDRRGGGRGGSCSSAQKSQRRRSLARELSKIRRKEFGGTRESCQFGSAFVAINQPLTAQG